MSVSLYRKYRPQDFASVVGQNAAVSILTNALTKNITGHAYLFSGSRGCGKTSIARIFAKALNCTNPNGYEPCGKCKNCTDILAGESLDVIEIDGASNNGVENIRNLRENINLAPFTSKHKIYIIDEVHMLSGGAFNALLKTLEEPPDYVVFIMATTEPYKVPVTIRSRCQHIPFHSINTQDIAQRLLYVCEHEGVHADPEALYEIARQADGALRDGLSLLEQVISAGEISLPNVEALLGSGSIAAFERIIAAFRAEPQKAFSALKAMLDGGASTVRVFEELFLLTRNMWLVSRWQNMLDALGLGNSEKSFLLDEVPHWKHESLHFLLDRTLKALTNARQGLRNDVLLGSFMLSLAKAPQITQVAQNTQAPQITQVAQNAQVATPDVLYNHTLHMHLLETARKADFTLFCALLDVFPSVKDNSLQLHFQHTYCFGFTAIDTYGMLLHELFAPEFGQVQLLCDGQKTFLCEPETDYRIHFPDATAPEQKPEPEQVHEPEPEQVPEPVQQQQNISAIELFRRNLALSGGSLEILLKKHSDLDTDLQLDLDTETEGDNDD